MRRLRVPDEAAAARPRSAVARPTTCRVMEERVLSLHGLRLGRVEGRTRSSRMREAEAVEIVEGASLEGLGRLSPEVVYTHVEYLGRELPGPVDLYQRWERQQWSATAIDFSVDRQQWSALPPRTREQMQTGFVGFFYGEQ